MLTDKLTRTSLCSRIITVSFVLTMIGMYLYNWSVSPKLNYIQAATTHSDMSNTVKKKIQLLENSARIKRSELEKLSEVISMNEVKFMTDKQSSDFFDLLESIIADHGCRLESLTFMNESRLSPEDNQDIDISIIRKRTFVEITGSFPSIVNFLGHLAAASPVDIQDLSIRSLDNKGLLLCKFNIISYNKNLSSLLKYDQGR